MVNRVEWLRGVLEVGVGSVVVGTGQGEKWTLAIWS